jgi:hypothetical protein
MRAASMKQASMRAAFMMLARLGLVAMAAMALAWPVLAQTLAQAQAQAIANSGVSSGTNSGPVVVIDYSNPGLTPAHWVMRLSADGSGHFRSERGQAPVNAAEGFEPANVDRDIQVSAEFAGHVFQIAHQHKFFHTPCESHYKLAFQGWKKLSYSGPDGAGECTFNYSKDKDIQWLGESLVAVAGTIVEGARLETLLQHDRLGLDKEMEFLTDAAKDGRLMEICTIREILERLADDPEVLDRVRKRARTLLVRADG